jgi:hypothetical protein
MRYFNPEDLEEQDQNNILQNYNPSELESALRGATQKATLGFADEIAGGAGALFDRLPNESLQDAYIRHRDESRAKFQKAQELNPKSYMAGEIIGDLAATAIPGFGTAKGVSLAKNALQAAKLGALAKLGASENLETAPQEMMEGALGGLENAVMNAIIPKRLDKINQRGKTLEAKDMDLDILGLGKVKDILNRPGNESLKEAILNLKTKQFAREKLEEDLKKPGGIFNSALQTMYNNYNKTGHRMPNDEQIKKAQEFIKNLKNERPLTAYNEETQKKAMKLLNNPKTSLPEKEALLQLFQEIQKRSGQQ